METPSIYLPLMSQHVCYVYFSVQLGDEIGSGFFGVVRKATDSSTGEVLAVKALKSMSL